MIALALLAGFGLASRVQAEPPSPHLLESPRLFGDPGGWRSRLEEFGIGLLLFYNQSLAWKPAGGGANPDSALGHSGGYDFFTLADIEELTGWPGQRGFSTITIAHTTFSLAYVAIIVQSNATNLPTLVVPICARIVAPGDPLGAVACASPVSVEPGERDSTLCD